FRVGVERRAAANKRPELPAEPVVNFAKPPPAFSEVLTFGRRELLLELVELSGGFVLQLDFIAQALQHARHRHYRRDPLAPDGVDNFGRVQAALKDHGGAEQRRHEEAEELPEDVAER